MKNKIILITGCSSGFGMLTALKLSDEGYTVYASMRNIEKQDKLQEALKKRTSHNIKICTLDVCKPQTIHKLIDEIKKTHGRLDGLVNNAGYGIGGFFEDLTDAEIRAQMDTNFFGVLNVTRDALPLLRKSNHAPKIINISSLSGFMGLPALSAYVSSKWALEGFSESLKLELTPHEIEVFLIEPGSFETSIFNENRKIAASSSSESSHYSALSKKVLKYVETSRKNKKPELIADRVFEILEGKRTKFRHRIGMDAKASYSTTH